MQILSRAMHISFVLALLSACDGVKFETTDIESLSNNCSDELGAEFVPLAFGFLEQWMGVYDVLSEDASGANLSVPMGGRLYVSTFSPRIPLTDARKIRVVSSQGNCIHQADAVGIQALGYRSRVQITTDDLMPFFPDDLQSIIDEIKSTDERWAEFQDEALFVRFSTLVDGNLSSYEVLIFEDMLLGQI